jgi:hypothetical protein
MIGKQMTQKMNLPPPPMLKVITTDGKSKERFNSSSTNKTSTSKNGNSPTIRKYED